MNPSIVFTGGGTAGHVTPNIALIKEFKEEGWDLAYVGSPASIERDMISSLNIPFYEVSSGKLRRYFSLKNMLDPFKIIWGIIQSFFLFYKLKPDVVFSKGGFVAFPVVVGAWLNRIPIVAHESDMTPGLANRLSYPFVNKICLTFDAGKKHFKKPSKIEVTGTPIRTQLFTGSRVRGLNLCGFNNDKPCMLVIGGSQGAGSINSALRGALKQILRNLQVIHLCGRGKMDNALVGTEGYFQLEYANDELADLLAASTIVLSRAGANSLYEILALGKPHILVPLSARVSRGDQIQNANYFKSIGISQVILDEKLTPESLLVALQEVLSKQEEIKNKIKALKIESATPRIVAIIKEQADVQSPRTV